MSASLQHVSCAQPESLVLIELLPLCRVSASDEPWLEAPVDGPVQQVEQPLRCASIMSCADAFALMEEVGHVAW